LNTDTDNLFNSIKNKIDVISEARTDGLLEDNETKYHTSLLNNVKEYPLERSTPRLYIVTYPMSSFSAVYSSAAVTEPRTSKSDELY
jgi:hypothetical protein